MKYQVHSGKVIDLWFHQWVIVRLIDSIEDHFMSNDGSPGGWFANFLAGIWLHFTLEKATK